MGRGFVDQLWTGVIRRKLTEGLNHDSADHSKRKRVFTLCIRGGSGIKLTRTSDPQGWEWLSS